MRVSTVEAMRGHEALILESFGLPSITNNKHVDCPICGSKKSFRINRHNNDIKYICTCSSGSVINLIVEVTGKQFAEVATELDKIIGNEFKPEHKEQQQKPQAPQVTAQEQATKRFSGIQNLRGSPVEAYLKSRGIMCLPEMCVKFAPSEWDSEYQRSFQAMYAVATDDAYTVAYAHKTYLEGGKKADVEKVKKLKTVNSLASSCKSCGVDYAPSVAVRMFPCDTILGISEGIETGLAAHQLYKMPVWSVLNTSIMKSFKAPAGVKTLMIFADNDPNGAGLAAAMVCANKNMMANNDVIKVTVRWVSEYRKDFNDLINEPLQTYEWSLNK